MEGNIYKPRYKVAFLSKNKVWSYKDSRLRRFFNIRGRKLVRRGLFKRYSIVFNSMKWVIARRYIRPFMRRRKQVKRKYKTAFYNKQQLRSFYGRCKEEAFRNFFRAHLSGITKRNDSFYSSLERRADMFFFRARLLPTIYAANQFVRHQGILLNNGLEKSPNALVRPGYILTVQQEYWSIFAEVLEQRLFFRWHAFGLLKKRVFTRLKKKIRWIHRTRKYHLQKEKRLFRKFSRLKRSLVPLKRILLSKYKKRMKDWKRLVNSDWLNPVKRSKKNSLAVYNKSKSFTKDFDFFRESNLLEDNRLLFENSRYSNVLSVFKKSKRKPKTFIKLFRVKKRVNLLKYSKYIRVLNSKFHSLATKGKKHTTSQLFEKNLNGNLTLLPNSNIYREQVEHELQTYRNRRPQRYSRRLRQSRRFRRFRGMRRSRFYYLSRLSRVLRRSRHLRSLRRRRHLPSLRRLRLSRFVRRLRRLQGVRRFRRLRFLRQLRKARRLRLKGFRRLRKSDGLFFRKLAEIVKFYKHFLDLFVELKVTELKQQLFILDKVAGVIDPSRSELQYRIYRNKKLRISKKITDFMEDLKVHLKDSHEELDEFVSNMIHRRVKYRRWKVWGFRNRKTGVRTKSLRKTPLFYFIMRKRRKLRRRLAVPRLKGVHWYVPQYIYFDASSMQSIMLHHPLSREIYFSFKGSLPKLYSYYKSR